LDYNKSLALSDDTLFADHPLREGDKAALEREDWLMALSCPPYTE